MPVCPLFEALVKRIGHLKAKFVLDQIEEERVNPLTFEPDIDRLAAFRLLCHAEIEVFLEAKAIEGLEIAEKRFQGGATDVRRNLHLLVVGETLGKTAQFGQGWSAHVQDVLTNARALVANNNGIKEAAFFNLSVFSGKMPDEVEPTLSLGLNAYGRRRGDVAHKSASRVTTIRAPSSEAKDVDDLIAALERYFYPQIAVASIVRRSRKQQRLSPNDKFGPPVRRRIQFKVAKSR